MRIRLWTDVGNKIDLYLVHTNVYETDRQVLPHFRDSNNELFVKKVESTHTLYKKLKWWKSFGEKGNLPSTEHRLPIVPVGKYKAASLLNSSQAYLSSSKRIRSHD